MIKNILVTLDFSIGSAGYSKKRHFVLLNLDIIDFLLNNTKINIQYLANKS